MGGPRSPTDQRGAPAAPACAINWAGRHGGGRPRALAAALALAALTAIQGLGTATPAQAVGSPQVTFRVSGGAVGLLYPGGPAQGIPLTLQNPTSSTVYVTQVSARVRDTGADGCDPGWFQTKGLDLPRGGIPVPPNSSMKLTSADLGKPTIQMLESGTDQTACRGTTLTLSYSERTHPAAAGQTGSPAGSRGGAGGSLPFTGLMLMWLAAIGTLLGIAGTATRRLGERR